MVINWNIIVRVISVLMSFDVNLLFFVSNMSLGVNLIVEKVVIRQSLEVSLSEITMLYVFNDESLTCVRSIVRIVIKRRCR